MHLILASFTHHHKKNVLLPTHRFRHFLMCVDDSSDISYNISTIHSNENIFRCLLDAREFLAGEPPEKRLLQVSHC